MTATPAATVAAYINTQGPVDDHDLDLVERCADVDVERRDAYWQGRLEERAALKAASVAICRALDWRREAQHLGEVERARAYRAAMLDPRPRPGDYPGRCAS